MLRLNSPVMIAADVAQRDELRDHADKVFRVMAFNADGRVDLHSVGGNPSRPTMIFGMGKSELVLLHAKT